MSTSRKPLTQSQLLRDDEVMARRRVLLAVGMVTLGGAFIWLGVHFAKSGWDASDKQSSVIGGFSGLWGLILAGFGIWQATRQQLPLSTQDLTRYLADNVQREWNAEVQLRGLHGTPWISVSWNTDMTPHQWANLLSVSPGATGPSDSTQDIQALAGEHKIIEILNRIPGRQLIILGERGSGKTTLLIKLLLDLLEQPESDTAVPVLMSLSSWNPNQKDLKSWIASELAREHPLLSIADRRRNARSYYYSRARALLDQGRIIPLLDGFDELLPDLYMKAIEEIGKARLPGLVLVSRSSEFEQVIHATEGTIPLASAPRIYVEPVNYTKAADYLKFGMPPGRWDPILPHLTGDGPLARALRTPLHLFLARTIYMPHGHQWPNPSELLDGQRFRDEHDIRAHLFDGYIDFIYGDSSDHTKRWTVQQARRALSFIARKLQATGEGKDIKWWQMKNWCNPGIPGLIIGSTVGVATGLTLGIPTALGLLQSAYVAPGISEGLLVGTFCGGLTAIFTAFLAGEFSLREDPAIALSWSPVKLVGLVSIGIILGFTLQSIGVVYQSGIFFGLALFAPSAIGRGVATVAPVFTASVGPNRILAQDRRTFLMITTLVGLVSGLPPLFMINRADEVVLMLCISGFVGMFNGLRVGLKTTAWVPFISVRFYFALRGHVPHNLMAFLSDAHKRGILRQVGTAYQFRHIDLQRHLDQD
ncbi:NACHT domain-containing protein [Streptomyces sp. HUAS 31]|uniref:NACHT domain-containing protein n=1 Tax=Streptomyces sp. HUAS 31 TaxID=3020055 RepID=UPI002305FBE4|nr:NACHT domain-containing protein [Streptomyces sp. HUAS 31]WCD96392.1 NACHT domain-containing protein [Streptomyces sp. HUAS 31]